MKGHTTKRWRIAGRIYEEEESRFVQAAAQMFANKSFLPCQVEQSENDKPFVVVATVEPSSEHERKESKRRKEAKKVLQDAQTDFWNKEKFNEKRGNT